MEGTNPVIDVSFPLVETIVTSVARYACSSFYTQSEKPYHAAIKNVDIRLVRSSFSILFGNAYEWVGQYLVINIIPKSSAINASQNASIHLVLGSINEDAPYSEKQTILHHLSCIMNGLLSKDIARITQIILLDETMKEYDIILLD